MNREYTQAEANQHNALAEEAWAILNDYIILHRRNQVRIGFFAKHRLRKAIRLFRDAHRIDPDNWSNAWALGKIFQVLGDYKRSLYWLEESFALHSGNADVCREASLAAMDCGEFSRALFYADCALALKPEDAGLHCNRALALMFLHRDADAIEAVASSLKLNPRDEITLKVQELVHSVANGTRQRPKTTRFL